MSSESWKILFYDRLVSAQYDQMTDDFLVGPTPILSIPNVPRMNRADTYPWPNTYEKFLMNNEQRRVA